MMKIAICTKDTLVKKKLELAVTQLMNSNQFSFHLKEYDDSAEIDEDTFLLLGDEQSLHNFRWKMMTIVVVDRHDDDLALSCLGIVGIVEKAEIDLQLPNVLMQWMDYYFDNYYYRSDDGQELFLPEVIYFEIHPLTRLVAHTSEGSITIDVKYHYHIFCSQLPKNFLVVGTDYVINLDKVVHFENGVATLSDGTQIPQVQAKKYRERKALTNLSQEVKDELTIGEKYTKNKILKSLGQAVALGLVVSILLFVVMNQNSLPIVLSLTCSLIIFLVLTILTYTTFLGSIGNFFRMREQGLDYYEERSPLKRVAWSWAILRQKEDADLQFLPFESLSYIRLGTTKTGNAISAAYTGVPSYAYHLHLKFETVTRSLDYDEHDDGKDILGQNKASGSVARLLNWYWLKGGTIENTKLLLALNDPNADLQQFVSKLNQKE